jgi:hypothetical protein
MSATKQAGKVERRRQPRRELLGALPGDIVGDDDQVYEVIPVDVSQQGLGLLLEPEPKVGERLELKISSSQRLTFEVKWIKKEQQLNSLVGSLDALCRCGLKYLGDGDLTVILAGFDNLQVGD